MQGRLSVVTQLEKDYYKLACVTLETAANSASTNMLGCTMKVGIDYQKEKPPTVKEQQSP